MTALPSRRAALAGALSLAVLPMAARATPETMRAAIAELAAGRVPRDGRVRIDIQPLVDNGNTVPMRVWVEGPADIRAIHVFNERNPQPHVLSLAFGPAAAEPSLATRIRLADTQTVVALAEAEDGTLWRASVEVIVTIAACVEGLV